MSCLKAPLITIPSLLVGISLQPPAIGVAADLELNFCCHLSLPFALQIQLPGLALSADLLAPIQVIFLEVDAILDLFELDCPFD